MGSNTIVYVGPYSFPYGGAAARRILGVCLTLRDAGFKTVIASGQMESGFSDKEYEGIPVFSLNERKYEVLPRLLKHLMYFNMGAATVKWLDALPEKPKAVILYSGYSPYLIRIGRWCRRNDVKFVFDAVEWYEAPSFFSRFFSPYYFNISLAMYYLLPRVWGLICISSFLDRYYKKRNCKTVRIPPTLDVRKVRSRKRLSNDVTRISYTGIPGKKDLLETVIKVVSELNSEGYSIELNLAGDCQAVLDKCTEHELLYIKYHGVLTHEDTLSLVRDSDYTVLFRPLQRSSEAGFSTKFVESISLGTPVLGNITGDLADHLLDGVTGFVSRSLTFSEIKVVIIRAVSLGDDDRAAMRDNCIRHAFDNFDYRNYISLAREFFK